MRNQVIMPFDSLLMVKDIGYGKSTVAWTHPDRLLDFHVFLYITSGRFQVIEDGVEYVLNEGDTFFLHKGLHHWGTPGVTLPGTSWYWIHFRDEIDPLQSFQQEKSAFSCEHAGTPLMPEQYKERILLPKRLQPSSPMHIRSKLKLLLELYHSPASCRPLLLSLRTAELFIELYQESGQAEHASKATATVSKILAYLEACNLSSKFNAQALAEHMNMNYGYLSTLFTKKVGVSIHTYFTRMRIHQAMELLKQPAYNISEVSFQLGFSSPYHFSHMFKKTCGLSPSQYLVEIYRS
ncbi:helix-turn-helix domain-containing protein [Paenibacillus roseipurpureus]|uniref:Helix-turn-helix domain-containing protein n=1 Tax=Paenibacillus roseopurpureus TaxID=2918901 RepID=A0AA96RH55_9BACL|nr:helix-turn-helix domain-containing protein [Paenibacillus sp. MBLB1832]WNR42948.1 helix-turn-helix domain-containing protein [Paenibacillus sp. MBLB1832]